MIYIDGCFPVSSMTWHTANLGASYPFPGSIASGWTWSTSRIGRGGFFPTWRVTREPTWMVNTWRLLKFQVRGVKWVHEPFPLDKSRKLMKLMLLNVKSLQISVDFEFHCEGKPVSYCIHSDISSREHRHPGGLFLVAPGEVSVVVPNDFSSSLT